MWRKKQKKDEFPRATTSYRENWWVRFRLWMTPLYAVPYCARCRLPRTACYTDRPRYRICQGDDKACCHITVHLE